MLEHLQTYTQTEKYWTIRPLTDEKWILLMMVLFYVEVLPRTCPQGMFLSQLGASK